MKLFIHVFGYPLKELTGKNRREIDRLLKRTGLKRYVTSMGIEEGKFVVIFRQNDIDISNQFKIRMEELAFRPFLKDYQLPLVSLAGNLRVKVSCEINCDIKFEQFMAGLSFPNGLSASLWKLDEIKNIENQKNLITFFIDPPTFIKIHNRGNLLNFKRPQTQLEISIVVVENPLKIDMDRLIQLQ